MPNNNLILSVSCTPLHLCSCSWVLSGSRSNLPGFPMSFSFQNFVTWPIYDRLLVTCSTSRDHKPEEAHLAPTQTDSITKRMDKDIKSAFFQFIRSANRKIWLHHIFTIVMTYILVKTVTTVDTTTVWILQYVFIPRFQSTCCKFIHWVTEMLLLELIPGATRPSDINNNNNCYLDYTMSRNYNFILEVIAGN